MSDEGDVGADLCGREGRATGYDTGVTDAPPNRKFRY